MGDEPKDHVLVKRGLYYRPNGNGYTGLKCEAGLYAASYAVGAEGVDAIPFANAPEFAPACWEETKIKHLQVRLAAVEAERDAALSRIEDLRAANAGNFDSEGKYWRGYDQACLDCHAALKGTDHG